MNRAKTCRRWSQATIRILISLCAVPVLSWATAGKVAAAPEEIQVYLDDVNQPREFGLEMHVNYVADGPRTPDYPGQLPSNHVLQMTPEFSYGIAKNWDVGLYLLSTLAPGGNFDFNGAKLRLKYIAPSTGAVFWGMNFEIGRTSRRVSEDYLNTELRPILGWRGGQWLLAINPIIDVALSGGASHEPVFAPALKIARSVGEGVQLGIEHHAEMGPFNHMPAFNQQNHVVYGVLDLQKGALDLNVGIGHGVTSASEKWVAKMIIGIPFK